MQAGDIINGNGTSGTSIYGSKFDDENFSVKHDSRGIVSMFNAGPNTNNSQFLISFKETPFYDNRYVAFGRVIGEASLAVLDAIEAAGVASEGHRLTSRIIISEAGLHTECADPACL
jgi:cyclophilin family peptidyl-prolyl cis-trans isomerase